ncbi:MAG: GDSL-type esterase/lipase family protein [Litoreibacter sp.]|nr:GDSL-type esterase/lipase family protein [Litoreibacter sp.]MCY4333316.1 GDSL-type esterase/lipase family protein [Litoreibacter sp.]
MKSVLIFGDSLTWGSRPDGGGRHAFEDRWPNVLQAGLGPSVEVIADGLRGRTTAMDQHASPANMNGAALLPSALYAHAPLDLVVIALGANDVYWGYPLQRALRGLEHLAEIVTHHPLRVEGAATPKRLFVLPQLLVPCDDPHVTPELIATSYKFIELAQKRLGDLGVPVFLTEEVAQSSPLDGIHLDAGNTRALGEALIPVAAALLDE